METKKKKKGLTSLIIAIILAIVIISCVSKNIIYNYHEVKIGKEADTLRQTKLLLKCK